MKFTLPILTETPVPKFGSYPKGPFRLFRLIFAIAGKLRFATVWSLPPSRYWATVKGQTIDVQILLAFRMADSEALRETSCRSMSLRPRMASKPRVDSRSSSTNSARVEMIRSSRVEMFLVPKISSLPTSEQFLLIMVGFGKSKSHPLQSTRLR